MSKSKKQDAVQNEYHGKDALILSENSLPTYNRFIVKSFMNSSKLNSLNAAEKAQFRTLDFGAGYGALAMIWRETTSQEIECLEIDPEQIKALKTRGFIAWNSLSEIKNKFRFIYSSNVLEHIEDDGKCLKELTSLLEQGGRIGIYVPAFMLLFSDLDRSVGHYRRYRKKDLIKKVENAGLTVIECQYVDSFGFFASLVIKVLGWKSVGNIGSAKSLKFYDSVIFPISRFFDRLTFGKVLGKNLILIAEK